MTCVNADGPESSVITAFQLEISTIVPVTICCFYQSFDWTVSLFSNRTTFPLPFRSLNETVWSHTLLLLSDINLALLLPPSRPRSLSSCSPHTGFTVCYVTSFPSLRQFGPPTSKQSGYRHNPFKVTEPENIRIQIRINVTRIRVYSIVISKIRYRHNLRCCEANK